MSNALLHELGRSLSYGRLPLLAKVLWPMLLAASDDQGRGLAEADAVKWYVCQNVPELTLENIPDLFLELEKQGMVHLYANGDGNALYQVVNWWKYQKLKYASPSKYPPPSKWLDRLRYYDGSRIIEQNWPKKNKHLSKWQRLRLKILGRDNDICQYCGAVAQQVDHIFPRSRGGKDVPKNLVAACVHCNTSKGARTPEEAGLSFIGVNNEHQNK